MATIRNITNSFIQFGGGGDVGGEEAREDPCYADCADVMSVCLPMHDIVDVAFQLLLIDSDAGYRADFAIGLYNGSDCPETITGGELIDSWTGTDLQFVEIDASTYLVIFDIEDRLDLCDILADGACLKFILFETGTDQVFACSNCFAYKENTCYTKQLKYGNYENAFGFYYENYTPFYNRIRLNITVSSPQFPAQKKVFRLSDGSYKKLAVTMAREYAVLCDYMDENMHQSMAVALQHDLFYLYNEETEEYEKRMDDEDAEYEIDWQDKPGNYIGLAQANVKIKVDPYFNENSNC